MAAEANSPLRVLIVGAGVAAMESALALRELAGERVSLTLLAPNTEFVYRPMTVREPFALAGAARYPLPPILAQLDVEQVADKLAVVDVDKRLVHTAQGAVLEYDALVLALGASQHARYRHAVTIDDRRMDEALHGLIQDIEMGYLESIAFVAPGRMAWPLPLYELALMTAGRAYDMSASLEITIVTPEDAPLAIFGQAVSDGVAALLAAKDITTFTSSYAEIPQAGNILINPGTRRLQAKRVVALPELFGPAVRGLPLGEHGFIHVNRFCRVPDVGPVFAAGDAVDFPVKQGGIAAGQADVVAESIAKLAGVELEPRPFRPVVHGVLLTDDKPRYLAAEISGGQGFSSQFSETPIDGGTQKIAARYLAPYLARLDDGRVAA
jgi:sulfide:quinone oxidoreductase